MTAAVRPEDSPAEARLQRLLHRFVLAAQAHQAALEALDDVRAEAHARMLSGLNEALAGFGEEGVKGLLQLVDSSDPVVAGMAAVYSIRRDSGRCLATLHRVAEEPGLLGFRARVAIERWESGEWGE